MTPQEPTSAPAAPDAAGTDAPPSDPQGAPAAPQPVAGRGRSKATAKKRAKAGKPGRKIGPHARERAYQLIVEGYPLRAIARDLAVRVETVIGWRDSVEGRDAVAALKAKRNQELGATLRQGRMDLEALVPSAIEALRDALGVANPQVRVRAAREILDRAGLPRTEVHEERGGGDLDLSALSAEELDTLRDLHAKASERTGGPQS